MGNMFASSRYRIVVLKSQLRSYTWECRPQLFLVVFAYRLEITEVDKAVLSLKTQRKRLEEFRSRTVAQIDGETVRASENLTKHRKDLAAVALKRRKIQQKVLVKIDEWLVGIESLVGIGNPDHRLFLSSFVFPHMHFVLFAAQ